MSPAALSLPSQLTSFRRPGDAEEESIYLDDPFISEDSSQLLQFFALDTNTGVISFLGQANRDIPNYQYKGPYSIGYNGANFTAITIDSASDCTAGNLTFWQH